MDFYIGLHQPADAASISPAMISVNRLRSRKSAFAVRDWIMDSGAFSTILRFGGYQEPVSDYAHQIKRWSKNGNLLAAVAQDYMCEPHMLAKTGLTIEDHQRLTIERYDALLQCDVGGVRIMPVLQGYSAQSYVEHIRQYGARLHRDMWVGVGSVCKRNADPKSIEAVLLAIKRERPDLYLHGFGIKSTALKSSLVRSLLHSADSMAWSYHARSNGRNGNDWKEARAWLQKIIRRPVQSCFDIY